MNKKILYAMLLCAGMLLASCGGSSDNPQPEPTPEPTPVTPTPTPTSSDPLADDDFKADDSRALHVEGRFLKDSQGKTVNMHGFTQTFSPWFNATFTDENGGKHDAQWNWQGDDWAGCLRFNKKVVDDLFAAGWKFNFVRMHLDPAISNEGSFYR